MAKDNKGQELKRSRGLNREDVQRTAIAQTLLSIGLYKYVERTRCLIFMDFSN